MNKPQPKREITVVSVVHGIQWITVRVASPDAAQWLQDECGQFGTWCDDLYGTKTLRVYAEYDVDEVVAYIKSYEAQS